MTLHDPRFLQAAMKEKGIKFETLYKAMCSEDLSEVVMVAHDILNEMGYFSRSVRDKARKCERISNRLREEGNAAYCSGAYQLALELYNKALAYAPEGSRAMKLVYSNRSALLLKNFNFVASLNDIEKCFAMGCPEDIKAKLSRRKVELFHLIHIEKMALEAANTTFIKDFFKFANGKENPDLPCASTDVGVVMEGDIPKIVATNNIKVGTSLALETAFATMLNKSNQYFACYYCNKISLNLMACPGCCYVLYCSEKCKQISMDEGHNIECPIMDIIQGLEARKVNYALKCTLKIKSMSGWNDFINAANNLGTDRIHNGILKDIFDVKKKFSLLAVKNDTIFLHGRLYSYSFCLANIMHYLKDVHSFLPADRKESVNALRALMSISMYLALHAPPTVLTPCAGSVIQKISKMHQLNFGSFSFLGKLKHSCHPNCLEVSLNNKVALVAIKPIKSGTELTISKLGQYEIHEHITANGKLSLHTNMFDLYGTVCECVCTDDELNSDQKKMVSKLNDRYLRENVDISTEEVYRMIVQVMAVLSNVQHTEEYRLIYGLFLRCILRAQDVATRNVVIDFNHFE